MLLELLNKYKNNRADEKLFEEIRESIKKITIKEFEDYYLKLYTSLYDTEISNGKIISKNLKEMNDITYKKLGINKLFNEKICVFNDFKIGEVDYDFFKFINESDFIKSLSDEIAEHGVREGGKNLSATLGGICTLRDYKEIDPIEMYAFAWLRLNTTHPFKNGNKRTSFIGVKSKMFIDVFLNMIEFIITEIIAPFDKLIDENKISKATYNKLMKQLNYWNKPKFEEIDALFKEYKDCMINEIWISISNTPRITQIVNDIIDEIPKGISQKMYADYILSIFIAKITAEEYKANDGEIESRAVEILKADLLLLLTYNQMYILEKCKEATKVFENKPQINLIKFNIWLRKKFQK